MNIKLQFLKRGVRKPGIISLALFSLLNVTVAHQSAASLKLVFDPLAINSVPTAMDNPGYKGSVGFFQAVDVTITGVVLDQNNQPIPGATVSVPGTGFGTATDMDGKYSITVPEGSTLIFSFIGFQSHTVVVGTQT